MKSSSIRRSLRCGVLGVVLTLGLRNSLPGQDRPLGIFGHSRGGEGVGFYVGHRLFAGGFYMNYTGGTFGDIDGDGRLDWANPKMGILLGNGDGTFGIRTVHFTDSNPSGGIYFASNDLNRDGRADLVVLSGDVRLYYGNPDGTLTFGGKIADFRSYPADNILKLVDLDSDGEMDILAGSVPWSFIAFNQGGGVFEPSPKKMPYLNRSTLGDFNQDGLLDIVTVGNVDVGFPDPNPHFFIHVYLGMEPRSFSDAILLPLPGLNIFEGSPSGVAAGDLDGDRRDDIMAGSGWYQISVFFGLGDGTFEPEMAIPVPPIGRYPELPRGVFFQDLDGDGPKDLLVDFNSKDYLFWGLPHGFVEFGTNLYNVGPSEVEGRLEVIPSFHRWFIRGDANGDRTLDISDVQTILEQLFLGSPMICGDASDADDSGRLNITDAIYLLSYFFFGGFWPSYPFPDAGGDQSSNLLGCSYEAFNWLDFQACFPDQDQTKCKWPIRQFVDVGSRE